MSWELDLWGKLRRATEAARADLLASEENRLSVILSLTSAVATSYVTLIDLDRQLEIAKSTAASRGEFYRIFKLRFEGGVVSQVELEQARSDYELALSTIPVIEKQIGQQENALSVLLGRNPGPIARDRTIDKLALPQVPAGLPSELLERRPDLRQAEQQLIAANARIGVAKAQFFPSISLTALLGTASASLSGLFQGAAKTWAYAGSVAQPIFTGGSLMSQLLITEAQQKQALLQYQKAIQTSFQEVSDALIDQAKTREQLAAQARQVEALARLRATGTAALRERLYELPRGDRRGDQAVQCGAAIRPGTGPALFRFDQCLQGDGRRLGGRGGAHDRPERSSGDRAVG